MICKCLPYNWSYKDALISLKEDLYLNGSKLYSKSSLTPILTIDFYDSLIIQAYFLQIYQLKV